MNITESSPLSPDAIRIVKSVADHGSMAAAARVLNLVPSALTYRVRQIEDALDVLLFDRSSRQAKLTAAGQELLREGERVLQELDAVANRVRRVATGWEPQFTIAVDSIIVKSTVYELTEAFFSQSAPTPVPTRLRIREETLSGTWHALLDGKVDLAIGVVVDTSVVGISAKPLGEVPFVFAVAPHHPLATLDRPLTDEDIQAHRIVAVADSTLRPQTVSVGILSGQDVFTVPNMSAKLHAQLRGLGCGNLPECIARPYIDTGRLVVKATERSQRVSKVSYAWRTGNAKNQGRALQWWLHQLQSAKTRQALLHALNVN
jgi:DNA-binding transcriptional LysR family regulator